MEKGLSKVRVFMWPAVLNKINTNDLPQSVILGFFLWPFTIEKITVLHFGMA